MFCAHLDTVPHRGQVEVVDDEGVFRSRGETILGADNKAAVAVFMELVARHAEAPGPVGIELVLTRRRGAGAARRQGLRHLAAALADVGFVLDHAGPVGEVIVATPTQQKILADFSGVEAHAGIRPEDGSSAIAAAAAAVARMELGRLDEGTTANVGLIEGGTSGNVVPGHCWIAGRGAQPRRRARRRGRRADRRRLRLGRQRARLRRRRADRRALPRLRGAERLAGAGAGRGGAARRRGSSRERVAIGGGSDANAFRLDGFDCVLLANGTDAVHTADESVPAAQPRRRCSRSARGSSPARAARRPEPVAA